jgi:gliding motility-associated-like protein
MGSILLILFQFQQPCSYQIEISGIGAKPNIDAGEDIFVLPGTETQLQGSGEWFASLVSKLFFGQCNFLFPIFHSLIQLLTYYSPLRITSGCEYQDIVRVYVEPPLVFYNTITPNNDGKNDFWTIKNIENYPFCKVEIYNKWGQQVYQNVGYGNSQKWDGTNNGKPLSSGTYFYILDNGSDINSEIFKGTINLLR